jgi:hypothetical protein
MFLAGPEMPATTGTHKDLRLLFFLLYTPRLPASVSRGVADSPYRPCIGDSGSRRLPVSVSRGVADSPYR